MKKTIQLGKIDFNGIGRKINAVDVEIRLDNGNFSVMGRIWNSTHTDCICGGQCLDEIRKYIRTKQFRTIHRLWKKWHLNHISAGTQQQTDYLDSLGQYQGYDWACEELSKAGLYGVDHNGKHHRYGHAWIKREISPEDLQIINELLA